MKHQKLSTIKFGNWWFDHNEFKLLHRDFDGGYFIDVNELDEAEAVDWLGHLKHMLSQRDVEDFVRIVKVLFALDKSAFRRMNRKPKMKFQIVAERIVIDKMYENRQERRKERAPRHDAGTASTTE